MDCIRSAVILAGGRGRRIGGEKAFMEFFGKTMIERAVEGARKVAEDVIVVARDGSQAERIREMALEVRVVPDLVSNYGPVAGLASGMACAEGELALAIGCDLPFLNPGLLDRLFCLAKGHDAAIPLREDGVMERLHAVYRADLMAKACNKAIVRGCHRIASPLNDLDVKLVPTGWLRSVDPELLSFFNINTEKDLVEARRIWLALDVVLEKSVDDVGYYGKQGDLENQASECQEEYGD